MFKIRCWQKIIKSAEKWFAQKKFNQPDFKYVVARLGGAVAILLFVVNYFAVYIAKSVAGKEFVAYLSIALVGSCFCWIVMLELVQRRMRYIWELQKWKNGSILLFLLFFPISFLLFVILLSKKYTENTVSVFRIVMQSMMGGFVISLVASIFTLGLSSHSIHGFPLLRHTIYYNTVPFLVRHQVEAYESFHKVEKVYSVCEYEGKPLKCAEQRLDEHFTNNHFYYSDLYAISLTLTVSGAYELVPNTQLSTSEKYRLIGNSLGKILHKACDVSPNLLASYNIGLILPSSIGIYLTNILDRIHKNEFLEQSLQKHSEMFEEENAKFYDGGNLSYEELKRLRIQLLKTTCYM